MSETKAAFPERTKRSLKSTLYRYIEDNGYKYIHKVIQFVTTLNSRKNCSLDLIPKNIRNCDFLSSLHSKPLREFRNPSLKLEIEFASRSMTYPSGRVISHSLHKMFCFEIVSISSKKPPTYTIKDEQDEIIRGKFYQKELIKVI